MKKSIACVVILLLCVFLFACEKETVSGETTTIAKLTKAQAIELVQSLTKRTSEDSAYFFDAYEETENPDAYAEFRDGLKIDLNKYIEVEIHFKHEPGIETAGGLFGRYYVNKYTQKVYEWNPVNLLIPLN